MLLDAGADVERASATGTTPLFVAALHGQDRVIKRLLAVQARRRRSASWTDEGGLGDDDADAALAALLEGPDVNALNADGASALFAAAQGGHVGAMRALLAGGADAQLAGDDGWTPLLIAAQGGHADAIMVLLGHGADVNRANADGATPLLVAAQGGHTNALAALLSDAGADADAARADVAVTATLVDFDQACKDDVSYTDLVS